MVVVPFQCPVAYQLMPRLLYMQLGLDMQLITSLNYMLLTPPLFYYIMEEVSLLNP
jgi:hypothetical protein